MFVHSSLHSSQGSQQYNRGKHDETISENRDGELEARFTGGFCWPECHLSLKGHRTGGLIFGGVALATLASEYPEKFAEIRAKLPDYVERGSTFLEVVSRVGERLADVAESRGSAWLEALM